MATAVSLCDLGLKVAIIDRDRVGSGASGVPLGLINPAAAKQAHLSWNAENCIRSIASLLDRAASISERRFHSKSGVLRPAIDEDTLKAYRKSAQNQPYPEGWAHWITPEAIATLNPELAPTSGGVWINEAYTVDVAAFLNALLGLLMAAGSTVMEQVTVIEKSSAPDTDVWSLKLSDGTIVHTSHVINTTGASILDDSDWNWLPVHRIKGQLACYRSQTKLMWSHAVAARGYVAHLDNLHWVVGSTFEHNFTEPEPDAAGLQFLERKVDSVLPALRQHSELREQWSGIRLATPNRLPIVGRHPTLERHWIFAGLGSKGLLYSAYLSSLLAQNILLGAALPKEVDVARLYPVKNA